MLGLERQESLQLHSFNQKNIPFLLILIQFLILSCIFFLFKTETFSQYAESFYTTSTMLATCCNFAVRIVKLKEEFDLVQSFENMIHKRKYIWGQIKFDKQKVIEIYSNLGLENDRSKIIYERVNSKVEKFTEFLNYACMNITLPCLLVPNFVTSYVDYFLSEAGDEAYRLPFLIWLVWFR